MPTKLKPAVRRAAVTKKALSLTLSKKSRTLIDTFSARAQSWGWASDQGNRNDAELAETEYKEAYAALANRVAKMEKELTSLRTLRRGVKLMVSSMPSRNSIIRD